MADNGSELQSCIKDGGVSVSLEIKNIHMSRAKVIEKRVPLGKPCSCMMCCGRIKSTFLMPFSVHSSIPLLCAGPSFSPYPPRELISEGPNSGSVQETAATDSCSFASSCSCRGRNEFRSTKLS